MSRDHASINLGILRHKKSNCARKNCNVFSGRPHSIPFKRSKQIRKTNLLPIIFYQMQFHRRERYLHTVFSGFCLFI